MHLKQRGSEIDYRCESSEIDHVHLSHRYLCKREKVISHDLCKKVNDNTGLLDFNEDLGFGN